MLGVLLRKRKDRERASFSDGRSNTKTHTKLAAAPPPPPAVPPLDVLAAAARHFKVVAEVRDK